MGHRLSKITTRTGDDGETGLGTGARVAKTSARVVAMGEIDELNSLVGVVLSHTLPEPLAQLISPIQHELFDLGGELAMPGYELLGEAAVARIEEASSQLNDTLPPLQEFILPGGNAEAAYLHLARAVARRCERAVWKLAADEDVSQAALAYLNRLSDLFFNAARIAARTGTNEEITWLRQDQR